MKKEKALLLLEQYLLSTGKSYCTIKNYKSSLTYFINWLEGEHMDLGMVNYIDVLSYVDKLRKRGNNSRSINQELVVLEHFYEGFRLLKEKESLEKGMLKNPVKSLRVIGMLKEKREENLTEKALSNLYKTYEGKGIVGKRNKLIVGMLVYQGLRSKEVSDLKLEEVDLRKGKLKVKGSSRSNERLLDLRSEQIMELHEYIENGRKELMGEIKGEESPYLYISRGCCNRIVLNQLGILNRLEKIDARVKTLHQLRSSVIGNWLKILNIREVQYRSGHKKVSSTQRYEQKDLKSLQKRISELHPLSQRIE